MLPLDPVGIVPTRNMAVRYNVAVLNLSGGSWAYVRAVILSNNIPFCVTKAPAA